MPCAGSTCRPPSRASPRPPPSRRGITGCCSAGARSSRRAPRQSPLRRWWMRTPACVPWWTWPSDAARGWARCCGAPLPTRSCSSPEGRWRRCCPSTRRPPSRASTTTRWSRPSSRSSPPSRPAGCFASSRLAPAPAARQRACCRRSSCLARATPSPTCRRSFCARRSRASRASPASCSTSCSTSTPTCGCRASRRARTTWASPPTCCTRRRACATRCATAARCSGRAA
mmetsp:Transcript_36581/g.120589  ORF Transcript_36581/g.120589 Transcript_36581/m.120589 type:complete len:229 (-) Transcript_36581:536-1222(-)